MRIHHLNCACMRPFGGAFYDGFSKGLTARLACHCLLVETESGLALVDTGIGIEDIRNPKRLSAFFVNLNRIRLREEHTAVHQLYQLGFSNLDVRHIIMTHLDFDHAGGLADFPRATVHVMQSEMQAARSLKGFIARRRYRPVQWDAVRHWEFYSETGEGWRGFGAVRNLKGLPPEIIFVPLAGHTPGHAGVAVQTPDGWIFDAGDAYFYRGEMDRERYRCTPGLRFYQWMMETNRRQRLENQKRLRRLVRDYSDMTLFCSYDQVELDRLAAIAAQTRVGKHTDFNADAIRADGDVTPAPEDQAYPGFMRQPKEGPRIGR